MRISQEVMEVLDGATVDGNLLILNGQLDRATYSEVNKVILAAGGVWNRKYKAHVFQSNIDDMISNIIATGEVVSPRDFDYFPTPLPIVKMLASAADLFPNAHILEPSAGRGAIAGYIESEYPESIVDCIDILEDNVKHLKKVVSRGSIINRDFISIQPGSFFYDRIIMNPPFGKRQDIHHVYHAMQFLKPDGLIVSIMSAGVQFRTDKIGSSFRELVYGRDGTITDLPEGSFKESGTMVRTVMVIIPGVKYKQ